MSSPNPNIQINASSEQQAAKVTPNVASQYRFGQWQRKRRHLRSLRSDPSLMQCSSSLDHTGGWFCSTWWPRVYVDDSGRIESSLRNALAHTPFLSQIHHRTIALLRSGECTTFFQALEAVKKELREGKLDIPDGFIEEGMLTIRKEVNEICEVV